MASEDKKPKAACFDGEAARSLVKELRGTFDAGKTKSYEWRVLQLKSLLKLTKDHEDDIIDALRSDLSKPVLEAFVSEVQSLFLYRFGRFKIAYVDFRYSVL
ncbi:hypothetical protein Acr_11g0009930 [Actinidia rufa]|uniref:Uncharacterized protein n=1 Tax=Actinidia rufa TaxID=165716 RepID=A0A7J0FFK7_9ERIC|nr:hypothetical protein Acr_11g0009930 [Actinidia rufa]